MQESAGCENSYLQNQTTLYRDKITEAEEESEVKLDAEDKGSKLVLQKEVNLSESATHVQQSKDCKVKGNDYNQAHTCKTLGVVTKPMSIASTHAQMHPRNIIHARNTNFILATTPSA